MNSNAAPVYDAIVLDPPKFAPTAAHAERAARAYKDINRLALKLLAPGGLLYTFSCSAGINADLFHKIVAGAAIDAGSRRRRSCITCTSRPTIRRPCCFRKGTTSRGWRC